MPSAVNSVRGALQRPALDGTRFRNSSPVRGYPAAAMPWPPD